MSDRRDMLDRLFVEALPLSGDARAALLARECGTDDELKRDVQSLLAVMVKEGELSLDFDDEVIAGACITRDGRIVHEGAKQAAGVRSSDAGGGAPSQDAGLEAPRR